MALREGFTTGSAATAAAMAAFARLLGAEVQEFVSCPLPPFEETDDGLLFPAGRLDIPISSVTLHEKNNSVRALVIKDGGDDPDVTNGLPIVATVSIDISEKKLHTGGERQQVIQIHGGQGVGTVTLPGLGLEVGGPAINTTPRQMITENLLHILDRHTPVPTAPIHVTISVPGGEEVAARTFNPRLGVVGGISIIGTSGIVKPFSSEAFVNSIRKEMSVARATGSPRIVINSGAKSEKYIRNLYPELPSQAFVHYGNFIGETIRIAAELGILQLTLGVMIGKAIKLAEGHLDTHSKKVTMNKEFLKEIARQSGCNTATVTAIEGITLARELWELLPEAELQAFNGERQGNYHVRQRCAGE